MLQRSNPRAATARTAFCPLAPHFSVPSQISPSSRRPLITLSCVTASTVLCTHPQPRSARSQNTASRPTSVRSTPTIVRSGLCRGNEELDNAHSCELEISLPTQQMPHLVLSPPYIPPHGPGEPMAWAAPQGYAGAQWRPVQHRSRGAGTPCQGTARSERTDGDPKSNSPR